MWILNFTAQFHRLKVGNFHAVSKYLTPQMGQGVGLIWCQWKPLSHNLCITVI